MNARSIFSMTLAFLLFEAPPARHFSNSWMNGACAYIDSSVWSPKKARRGEPNHIYGDMEETTLQKMQRWWIGISHTARCT